MKLPKLRAKKHSVKKGKDLKKEQFKEKKKTPLKEHAKKKSDEKKSAVRKLKIPRINLLPRFYIRWVEERLYFSGSQGNPSRFIATVMAISLIASVVSGFVFRSYLVLVSPAVFIVVFGILNVMLVLSVDRRGRFVDEILPDALLLLSANIRTGYIPSRALILSARTEFGPLSQAIRRAGKEIMTGKSLEEGLREIPKRIKSEDLDRTIDLIIQGIRGGGKIVSLLEENAMDIRRRQAIKKEIKANIMMYAIFIAFAGCLGAPALYALSGFLVETMSSLTPDTAMTSGVSGTVSFLQMSSMDISPEFLMQFSVAAILITTIFGGLILGLISSGRERDGLKFAPVLAVVALLVYFAASFIVSMMFSSIMPV